MVVAKKTDIYIIHKINKMSIINKNVLITGGAGFIGANFVHKFVDLKYNVNIIEKSGANLWRINKIKDKIKIHYVDLKDSRKLELCVAKIKPKIVLHFAAYGVFQRYQQDINIAIDTNLRGTINLINACDKRAIECFISTGTASEYGLKDRPMKEDDLLEPRTFYGVTKAATSMYCQMVAREFGFPIVIMRPFMAYGYFEEEEKLVPTIIKSCLTNTEMKLSKPNFVRDFIFIEDLIEAYFLAIKNIDIAKGEIFNLGTGKQSNIAEVVKIVKKITGSKISPKYNQVNPVQHEPQKWVADNSKAKKILGWKPKYDLENGLAKNIEWFKNNIGLYEKK